jgi:methionyl aminopeptidase
MDSKLENMREANRITHEVLQMCKSVILGREEITKEEVQILAEIALSRYNVKSAFQGIGNFPGIMCICVNDEIIHGLPDNSKIVKGDIVSLDFGVIKNGYYSDAAISFVNGSKATTFLSKKKKIVKDTEFALNEAIRVLRENFPNCKLSHITGTIEEIAKAEGYGIVSGYGGHGIGKELHEKELFIPNSWEGFENDIDLKIGDFFTIEPMFTLGTGESIIGEDFFTIKTKDGSLSTHFEVSLAITEKGVEILGKGGKIK